MSYQNATEPVKGSRRKGLLGLGVVLLVGGVGAGAALFVVGGSRYDEAVTNLQRAPVGCDTEFKFKETGTFVFYTETKGTVGKIPGSCPNTETDYEHGSSRVRVTLTLVDRDGNEVNLDRKTGITYDRAGFVGSAIRSIDIKETGNYVLSVESDDNDFAIAVGRNPKKDADSMKTLAIIVAAAGLVLGVLLVLLGMRRKPAPAAPAGFGGGGFGPTTPAPFGNAPFGGAPPGTYPQPYQQPGPPMVSPPLPPLPPVRPSQSPYPQPPPPPPTGGEWGAPTQ